MIMTAFPVISTERVYTPDNIQTALLNSRRVYKNFADLEHISGNETVAGRVRNLLAQGGRATSATRSVAFK